MSQTCEQMARRQNHSYRKSDDALLDVNVLGPVYCKIMRKRRKKGMAYKKEIQGHRKSVQTDFQEIACDQPKKETRVDTGISVDLDLKRLGRYRSLRTLRPL